MQDYLYALIGLFSDSENQLLIMFLSAFLSATILPGNSEVVFSAMISQHILTNGELFSQVSSALLIVATLGNSLGSMTSYFLARLLPDPQATQSPKAQLALSWCQKYGVWVLLFSWLPFFGDLFCVAAGWLRLAPIKCLLWIIIGKFLRYFILFVSLFFALN